MGFLLGGSCSPCCVGGCPESLTVTLTDLPHKLEGGGTYGQDNYPTSNEGTFHLKKIYETPPGSSGDKVCRWEYKDTASGGSTADYVVLRITLEHWTFEDRFGNITEDLRLYVEMDGGEIRWRKPGTTVDPQNYTFTNSDILSNSWAPEQPAGMQAVAAAYAPASRDQCDGYLPCLNWRDAATAEETCPQIMTVTDAMDSANYCGKPPTVFQQAVPGSSPTRYVEFIQGGTDSLNLTLPSDWVYSNAFTTRTIDWGGGTHSLGWGGYDNVNAYVSAGTAPNTNCGSWSPYYFYSSGWVSVFSGVTVTYARVGGGSASVYNCVAIAQANLVSAWNTYTFGLPSFTYPTRRILLKIALLYEKGGSTIGLLNDHSFGFASDGTLGEDAYTVGSFPTFTQSNASSQLVLCPFSSGVPISYNYTYRLEQG